MVGGVCMYCVFHRVVVVLRVFVFVDCFCGVWKKLGNMRVSSMHLRWICLWKLLCDLG